TDGVDHGNDSTRVRVEKLLIVPNRSAFSRARADSTPVFISDQRVKVLHLTPCDAPGSPSDSGRAGWHNCLAMTPDASAPRRKLSAIVMVDVSGFSRMMGRNEERTTALIREFHDRTQGLVEAHQGRVVDTAGDSVFGEFDSVVNAVRCAQAIQDAQ